MTREIKFRAWDKKQNQMFYDPQVQTTVTFEAGIPIRLVFADPSRVFMQHVGIKNFYEGDIVNDRVQNCIIVWDERKACFQLEIIYIEPPEGICQTHKEFPLDGIYLNLIGNMYQHPHLLKQPA